MRKIFFLIIAPVFLTLSCKTTYKNSAIPPTAVDTVNVERNTDSKVLQLKGVHVNAHGVALDTDGDGIPDHRDKELLTLQKCFPVDTSGVGVCPQPSYCQEFDDGRDTILIII